MERTQKIICCVTVALFILSGAGLGAYYFIFEHIKGSLYLGFATPLFLLFPLILYKLDMRFPYRLWTFFFIFLIMGYNIGFIMDGYKRFILYHYDKIVHFTSGFLFVTIGLCAFFHIQKTGRKNWGLGLSFALFFSMFIALTFEFAEYIVYLTTKNDPQLSIMTDTVDTMEDLAVCLFSSLITVFLYFLYFRKGLRTRKKPIIEEFCEINGL